MLGELSEMQINNVLSSQSLGRVACTDGMQPYIVPVTYVYDGEYVYAQSNPGSKIDIMRTNPKVCFEVDLMLDMANWQSVLVFGTFEELEGEAAEKGRRILFGRVLQLFTTSTVHAHEHDDKGEVDDSNRIKNVMFRIKIEKVTGRFEKQWPGTVVDHPVGSDGLGK